MSVSFTTTDIEYDKLTEHDPEYGDFESLAPKAEFIEINMSNVNAADLLRLLGRNNDARKLYGSWGQEELPLILEKLIKLSNIEHGFEKKTEKTGNLTMIGRDANYVSTRLDQFKALVKGAIKRSVAVTFS
jgi:hypothetical protein